MAGTDKWRPRIEEGPAIILVAPQLGENIGMVARAMANFGLADPRLVAPRDGWPSEEAQRAAWPVYTSPSPRDRTRTRMPSSA